MRPVEISKAVFKIHIELDKSNYVKVQSKCVIQNKQLLE